MLDRLAVAIRVEEVVALVADGLELPERHAAHRVRDSRDERPPRGSVSARQAERAAELRMRPSHGAEDDGVRLRDLVKHGAVDRRAVGDDRPRRDLRHALRRRVREHLAPVVGDELLGDVRDRDAERRVGVLPALDGDVDQRLEEREPVRGGEGALREESLELQQEVDLEPLGDHRASYYTASEIS